MNTRESTTILGAAVFDDVIVVILLAFVMSFLGTQDVNITLVIVKKIIFFVSIVFIAWKVVPWIMKMLVPLRVTEALISAALIICFSFSYYSEMMGIAGIIGAFAAGIAISQTEYKHEVEHKIEPIAYAIFVPSVLRKYWNGNYISRYRKPALVHYHHDAYCDFHKVNWIRFRSKTNRIQPSIFY